jgi:putative transcriptional regulator
MRIHHHPDESTLLSYTAGGLPGNAALLVSCHLQFCATCHDTIRDAELLGGELLEQMPGGNISGNARKAILARLDSEAEIESSKSSMTASPDEIPLAIQPWLGKRYQELDWSPLVPGVGQIQFAAPGGKLRLLNVTPGTSLPMHSHRDSELTLVLLGSYHDEIGHFDVGDVADLDPGVEHQPTVDGQISCVSLLVSNAPLIYRGIVPRLLQPFFGI